MKKVKPLEMAPWAKAEQRKKLYEEMTKELFLKVRLVFVLLFLATALVFTHNHYVVLQQMASEQMHQLAKKSTMSDKLREKALNRENEVTAIGQSSPAQTQTP